MKNKRTVLSLILIFMVAFSITCNASTIEKDDGSRYSEVDLYKNSFKIEDDKAIYSGTVTGFSVNDMGITASLQRYTRGKWVSIYTKSDRGKYDAWVAIERYIVKGYKYRVVSTCFYYQGDESIEEDNWTSKEIFY